MKTLIIWIWAFWFAILHHISKNNPEMTFYWYEKDNFVFNHLLTRRENPYFFHGTSLQKNVYFLDNVETFHEFDLIILALPAQYISSFVKEIKNNLKSWVIFLNLSKWIDNQTLQTPSDILKKELKENIYHYAVLSGGMIASELIEWKELWAQIWCENIEIAKKIKSIFQNKTLKIEFSKEYKNIELYWSLKNIFALYIWYLEWKWYGISSIWYEFCQLYKELPELLELLWWTKNIDFWDFALGWDLIATCFWNSRNRYFGTLVWAWRTSKEAENILKEENKHAEWYLTLQWIWKIIWENSTLIQFWKIVNIFLK